MTVYIRVISIGNACVLLNNLIFYSIILIV
jgi:hypothetical protein